MDPFYKYQNFLKRLRISLIIVHNVKQHRTTPRKAFYKRFKEGNMGFLNLFSVQFLEFLVDPYYEPLARFMIRANLILRV